MIDSFSQPKPAVIDTEKEETHFKKEINGEIRWYRKDKESRRLFQLENNCFECGKRFDKKEGRFSWIGGPFIEDNKTLYLHPACYKPFSEKLDQKIEERTRNGS